MLRFYRKSLPIGTISLQIKVFKKNINIKKNIYITPPIRLNLLSFTFGTKFLANVIN